MCTEGAAKVRVEKGMISAHNTGTWVGKTHAPGHQQGLCTYIHLKSSISGIILFAMLTYEAGSIISYSHGRNSIAGNQFMRQYGSSHTLRDSPGTAVTLTYEAICNLCSHQQLTSPHLDGNKLMMQCGQSVYAIVEVLVVAVGSSVNCVRVEALCY